MDWMFEDFKTDLDTLNPIVREKALSIAKELIEKKDISKRSFIRRHHKGGRMVLRFRRIIIN